MRSLLALRLISWREIIERLRSRLTWVMTVVTTLLVVGLITIPPLFASPPRPTVIGLVGTQAQSLSLPLLAQAQADHIDIHVAYVPTLADAKLDLAPKSASTDSRPFASFLATLRNSSSLIDVALSVDGTSALIEVNQSLSPTIAALLQSVVDQAHQRSALSTAGLPADAIDQALQPVPFALHVLSPPGADRAGRDVAALAAAFLLYASVGVFGAAVATGVAQEKTSRTAEVLLSTVRPRILMMGKVLGIGTVGLLQMTITVTAGLLASNLVSNPLLPTAVWSLLPAILFWFILGYTLYAFAFAAAGALIARIEEVQFATAPFTVLLIMGFLLTYATIASPDAWWVHLLSFFPPFTPILMPARLAVGHLAIWEMPLAALIMLASIYALARLAGRIYAQGLVHSGARLGWLDALRSH